jgi:hypothetical protein
MTAFIAILVMVSSAAPATQTWTGVISDTMCVRHHESGAEGQETNDADCTRDCAKGGSKYVLIVGEKVYAIANQQHAALAAHAGERVVVTGTERGDAIEVSGVEKAR